MGVTAGEVEPARAQRPIESSGPGGLHSSRSSAAGLGLVAALAEPATVPVAAGAGAVLTDQARLITDVVVDLTSSLGTQAAHARRHIHRDRGGTNGIE